MMTVGWTSSDRDPKNIKGKEEWKSDSDLSFVRSPSSPSAEESCYDSWKRSNAISSRRYSSLPRCPAVDPRVMPEGFPERKEATMHWFRSLTDAQRDSFLRGILAVCDGPQFHLLSSVLENQLHSRCRPGCKDFISFLPPCVSLKILSYLDPVSLATCCRVSRLWREFASCDVLWQQLCSQWPWQLASTVTSKKQKNGKTSWREAFVERYRLQRNWMSGQCHVRTFLGHEEGVACVQFDEERIVSGSYDKTIKVWNMRTNSPWSVFTLVGHSGTVRCLNLSGTRLVSGSSDCTIKIWDLNIQPGWSSIACKFTLVGHTDTVRCLQVSGDLIVSGSYDSTLKLWSSKTGECERTVHAHEGPVLCMKLEGDILLSGSADRSIKMWRIPECSAVLTMTGHTEAVTCVALDPKERVISGSLDRTIKFWNSRSGECLFTLDWMKSEGHTDVIRCLQVDGWRLITSADDKTLKVWSLGTRRRLVTLKNHTDGVTCFQFNDYFIVSGSYDKTVKLWDFRVC